MSSQFSFLLPHGPSDLPPMHMLELIFRAEGSKPAKQLFFFFLNYYFSVGELAYPLQSRIHADTFWHGTGRNAMVGTGAGELWDPRAAPAPEESAWALFQDCPSVNVLHPRGVLAHLLLQTYFPSGPVYSLLNPQHYSVGFLLWQVFRRCLGKCCKLQKFLSSAALPS